MNTLRCVLILCCVVSTAAPTQEVAPDACTPAPNMASAGSNAGGARGCDEKAPRKGGSSVQVFGGGGGGGGGGFPAPLDFDVAMLESTIPDRYPGTTAMGDGYNPVTGEVTFSVVDISVPGNFAIPFELRRWIPPGDSDTGGPTGWKWDLPHIKGNYLDVKPGHTDSGWDWGTTTWHWGENCTGDSDSVLTPPPDSNLISSNMYWEGKLLHIPGVTSEKFLELNYGAIQITKSNFKVESCITNNPGGQEGFVVVGPDGLTYTFNEIKSYHNGKLTFKDPAIYTRIILVTRIEDRFGNHVDYSYDANSNLTQILASDGRKITIAYATVGGITRPTTATLDNASPTADRVWTYNYRGTGWKDLASVTLPDGKQWQYSELDIFIFDPDDPPGSYSNDIDRSSSGYPRWAPSCMKSSTNQYATVTTPEGAVINYTFRETFHDRSDVEPAILWGMMVGVDGQARQTHCSVNLSLIRRKITGPGLAPFQWDYDYSENEGTYTAASNLNGYLSGTPDLQAPPTGFPSMINASTDVNYRSVTVSGPGNKTIYFINRQFQTMTESMVVAIDDVSANGNTLLKRTEKSFTQGAYVGVDWYKCPCGGRHPPHTAINATQAQNRINHTDQVDYYYYPDGPDEFTTTYSNFNSHGTPTTLVQSNDFNSHSLTAVTGYRDGTTAYILDQPTTVTVNSELTSEKYYDSNDQVSSVDEYGVEVREFGYNTDGTVAWMDDALNHRTTTSNWKRGRPRTVTFPDSTTRFFGVDDNGWVTSRTDQKSQTTLFGYDPMGRLTLIDYPGSDGINRLNKTIAFAQVGSADLAISGAGLVSGQWKRTATRGTYKKTRYLDALWRPVLTRLEDTTDGSLSRYSRSEYDPYDQVTFASFPSTSAAASSGVNTSFDGLRRVTETAENVTPYADTDYDYFASNKVRVTNPRGKQTTTTYLAVGAPERSKPVLIVQPESVTTTIVRNNLGEMTSATQSGGGVSATRMYRYDTRHNMCRRIDPESGSTAYRFDNEGRLTWYAPAAPGGTGSCNLSSVPTSARIVHSYNNMDRLTAVNYPDSSPDRSYGYDDNGNLTSLNSSSANWTYTYNAVDALKSETLATGGQTFALSYGFDTMDRLTSVTYPGSAPIGITPNAYGEPESVGSYATSIDYWPNGSIKELQYGSQQGSGRKYTTTQNARQLPANLKVVLGASTLANLTHSYDANGNVTFIDDAVNGSSFDRSMGYDDLDRLETASGFWGAGSYSFDALGNIRTKTESGIDLDYTYSAGANRLASIDDSVGSADYSFSYDSYGNVTNNGSQGFSYNLAGQMTSSTSPSVSYQYDGQNRRVQKTEGGQTGYTVYGANGRLMHKLKGGVSTHYLYAGSLLIAEKQGSNLHYIHTDLLGSPIKGDNGTSYSEHYRPWGEKKDHPTQLADDVGYTGHQSDIATGLTYMQARYYDPVVGRFMAVDPVRFNGSNLSYFGRYTYVGNNPINFHDPFGGCRISDEGNIEDCDVEYESEHDWSTANLEDAQNYEETIIDVGTRIQEGGNAELQTAWESVKNISFAPNRDYVNENGKSELNTAATNDIGHEPGNDKITIYRRAFEQDQAGSETNRRNIVVHEITHGASRQRTEHFTLGKRTAEMSTRRDTRKHLAILYPEVED